MGLRDVGYAYEFMNDLKNRIANRVQLTTDGHKVYLWAVEDAFGAEVDYAMLVKLYGTTYFYLIKSSQKSFRRLGLCNFLLTIN